MSDRELKRFRRLILLAWFLVLFLLIGIVAYFSFRIGEVKSVASTQASQIQLNSENIKKLQELIEQVAERQNIPGPAGQNGHNGVDGKNAVSTNTVVEKQTPIKGDKGDPFTFNDFTQDQLDSLKGKDARQTIPCKLADGTVGWKFVGTLLCQEVE